MKIQQKRTCVSCIVLLFFMCTIGYTQGISSLDKSIYKNMLPNGMTYYLRENKSEKNIVVGLIVNVGSVLENEKQRGSAYFVRPMAFSGTKKYPTNTVIAMLEKKGLSFGKDFNIFVDYDYTMFYITIPSHKKEFLDVALDVIYEWAFHITYDKENVEKEKKSLAEKIKADKQPFYNVQKNLHAFFFANSLYAKRNPMIPPRVINNVKRDIVKSFYDVWYKPNLMAVVVSGDIDVQGVKKRLKTIFTDRKVENAKRPQYAIPLGTKNDVKTRYFIINDKGQTPIGVITYGRKYINNENKKENIINRLAYDVAIKAINDYFFEVTKYSSNLSEVRASVSIYGNRYIQTFIEFFSPEGRSFAGYKEFLKELERLRRYGLSLKKSNQVLGGQIEIFKKIKKSNFIFLNMVANDFINKVNIIDYENVAINIIKGTKNTQRKFLAKVNSCLANIGNMSAVYIGFIVGKDEVLPKENVITSLYRNISSVSIERHSDASQLRPLTALITKKDEKAIVKGTILSKHYDSERKRGILVLSNGIIIIFQKTKTKLNDVSINATAQNAAITKYFKTDADLVTSRFIPYVLQYADFSSLSSSTVNRYLMKKSVDVHFFYKGMRIITADASVRNVKDVFQFLYLLFSGLRYNEAQSYKFRSVVKNEIIATISKSPLTIYYQKLALPKNPFTFNFTAEKADLFDPVRAVAIANEALRNPREYTFVVSGNITFQRVQELAEKYLGSLKTKKVNVRKATYDVGITKREKSTTSYTKGQKKSLVLYGWIKDQKNKKYVLKENAIAELAGVTLHLALTAIIKKQKSLVDFITPNIYLGTSPHKYTNLTVYFQTRPEKVQKTIKESKRLIMDLIEKKVNKQMVLQAKNIIKKQLKNEFSKSSVFVSYNLQRVYQNGEDVFSFNDGISFYDKISYDDIAKYLKDFLQNARYIEVVQNPEK